MPRKKTQVSASVNSLAEAVQVYGLAHYGTVAPLDWRAPLRTGVILSRQMTGSLSGPAGSDSYGELLLCVLVSAKRQGFEIPDVCQQALTEAEAVRADYETALARMADDGGPHAAE